jgi:hypothetical protein
MIKSSARDYSKELCFEEAFNNSFKAFQTSLLKSEVEEIFNDPKINDMKEKSNFWVMAAALKMFY